MAVIIAMTAIAAWAVGTDRLSYVITSGVSMNPVYYQNDLVFVRKADRYQVGDIAAYRGTATGIHVLHRIIGGDATHGFVFKGDNNQSIDVETPTADELLGKAVVHVPKGGVWLKPVLSPTGLGMMGFLIVSGGATLPRNRREVPRGRRKKKVKAMARQGGSGDTAYAVIRAVKRLPLLHQAVIGLAVLAALLGLVLGVLGYMSPTNKVQPGTGPTRSMVFSYSATVPRSAAYDGTTARSPDPIFRRLAHRVDVRMRYQGAPGTFSATAELTANSGWHTTLQLAAPQKFAGNTFETTGTLDLNTLADRAKAAAQAIGVASDTISVDLSARVEGTGTFTAPLALSLTPVQLLLKGGEASLTVTDGAAGVTTVARKVGFITAAAARSWSVFLLIIAAAGMIGVLLVARREVPARTRTEIERLHPQLLVHVEPMASPPGKPVVNVDNFPALVKLAERYGQMILTWRRPDADDFVVRDEGITYRYRVPLDEPTLQNVELINRPASGTHRRKASSQVS